MTPDNVPPEFGWPLAVVLWLVVIAVTFADHWKARR